jgi:hypothetical protein
MGGGESAGRRPETIRSVIQDPCPGDSRSDGRSVAGEVVVGREILGRSIQGGGVRG